MSRWCVLSRHPARDFYVVAVEFADRCWRAHEVSGVQLYAWLAYGLLSARPC